LILFQVYSWTDYVASDENLGAIKSAHVYLKLDGVIHLTASQSWSKDAVALLSFADEIHLY
jgi:hypothetical protein